MIFRKVFTSLIIIGLAAEVWSHVEIEAEDYFFPLEPVINFCKMSETCTHDFVPICGQDSLGISRMFSDNCDLFEYNCDEKKREVEIAFFSVWDDKKADDDEEYRHVKMEVCKYELSAAAEPEFK